MCKSFLRPADLTIIMQCAESTAYRTIRDLNNELKAKGAYVRSGRVSTKYFCERTKISPHSIEEQLNGEKE